MSALTPTPQGKPPPDPAHAFRVIRIVHSAFCGTVLTYGVFLYLMLGNGTIPPGGFAPDLPNLNHFRTILWLIAAGHVLAIRILRRRFLNAETLRRWSMPAPQLINAVHIVLFATAVAIAIYGVMLFMMAALLEDFLALAGVSLMVLYWVRPKEDAYRDLVRSVQHP
jgi:hypothetical protein